MNQDQKQGVVRPKKLIIFKERQKISPQNINFLDEDSLEKIPVAKLINDLVATEIEFITCNYCQLQCPKNEAFASHEKECYAKYTEQTICKQCNTMVIFQFMDDHLINCTKVIELQEIHKLKKQDDSQENTCTICAEKFDGVQIRQFLPCCHVYHQVCIQKWLKKKKICPQCRLEVKDYDSNVIEKKQSPQPLQMFRFQLPSFLDVSDEEQEGTNQFFRQIRQDLVRIHGLQQILGRQDQSQSSQYFQGDSDDSEEDEDYQANQY